MFHGEPTVIRMSAVFKAFLTVAAMVGLLYASGLIAPETGGGKMLGLVATVLAAMGYTVSRGMAKKKA